MSQEKKKANTQEGQTKHTSNPTNIPPEQNQEPPEAASKDVEMEQVSSEEDWEGKYSQLNDSHLRLMADFDNYKKKTLKEKSDLIKYGGETVFRNLLPIIDDFERAIAHLSDNDSPEKEGILLIHSKFIDFLGKNDVKEIPTQDTMFNTDFHEAITLFPTEDDALKGKIIDCTQKGYTYHDKVLRFAKVVVAN